MRILCASLMSGEGVVNGFTEKMKEVFSEGYYPLNPSHPNFNEELIRITLKEKPEIVFLQLQAPGIITVETAREIAKHSFVINWSGDCRIESPPQWYLDIGKEIQLSLFSNMRDVLGCREQGITSDWLECGFDPEKFCKWENPPQTREIVAHFNDYGAGAFPLSQYRIDIVNALSKEFGDRFGVYGNFPGAVGNFNSDQVAESKNYAGAKIAINCSHFEIEKYSSDRLSRIMGTGGALCLTHHFKGLDTMYDPYIHLIPFTNIEDLIKKCYFYLSHEDKRLEKVAAGQQHVLNNYSFEQMCLNIKNYYEKYKT